MNPSWVLIINPSAGGSRKRSARRLVAMARKNKMTVIETSGLIHLNHTVHDYHEKGHRHFIFMGGDGSIHRAINSFAVNQIPFDQVWIAFLPCGTGNDWAQFHRLKSKAGPFWTCLQSPKFTKVPLVKVTSLKDGEIRYCCNITGLGFDAFVVQQIALSGKSSKAIYLKKVLSSLTRYKALPMKWRDDHGWRDDQIFSFHVGIGQTAGGGLQIMPHAQKPPQSLYTTIVKKADSKTYLQFIPRLLSGKLHDIPFIEQGQTDYIEIHEVEGSIGVECDGELFGTTPISIRLSGQSIQVLDTSEGN